MHNKCYRFEPSNWFEDSLLSCNCNQSLNNMQVICRIKYFFERSRVLEKKLDNTSEKSQASPRHVTVPRSDSVSIININSITITYFFSAIGCSCMTRGSLQTSLMAQNGNTYCAIMNFFRDIIYATCRFDDPHNSVIADELKAELTL